MSNLAIVAIPAQDDYIHKISSEKVPHCTLLFLGDVEDKPVLRLTSFLQHAVEIMELGPFGFEVDYRGTLGDDEADVLYFKKGWSAKRIDQFRAQLLKTPRFVTHTTQLSSIPSGYHISRSGTRARPRARISGITRVFAGWSSIVLLCGTGSTRGQSFVYNTTTTRTSRRWL